ncbi:MAG: phosphodiester glycosidase family protein [Oligoflexales bacterium]|nr:phosphodiester glycosidase family protein [Oligoflexales bacterium]
MRNSLSIVLFSIIALSCVPNSESNNRFPTSPTDKSLNSQATVNVMDIPNPLVIDGIPIRNVSGYTVKITNPTKADFFVPDTENEPVECAIADLRTDYCEKVIIDKKIECRMNLKKSCVPEKTTCRDLGRMDLNGGVLLHPLHTGRYWYEKFPHQIMINANFFYVQAVSSYPYLVPCTSLAGPVISKGKVVSERITMDHRKRLFDVFGITKDRKILIETNAEFSAHENDFNYAIGGILIFKNDTFFTGRNKKNPYNRISIAMDGQGDLYLSAIWGKTKKNGLSIPQLIQFLRTKFDVKTIFQLDQGGSSFFHFTGLNGVKESPPFDNQGYRPIPNFLAIKGLKEI